MRTHRIKGELLMAYSRFMCSEWYSYHSIQSPRDSRDSQIFVLIHSNWNTNDAKVEWKHSEVEDLLKLEESEIIETLQRRYKCTKAEAQEAIGYFNEFMADVGESTFPTDFDPGKEYNDPDEILPIVDEVKNPKVAVTVMKQGQRLSVDRSPTPPPNTPMAVHVVPRGDIREHETSAECWCAPTPDTGASNLYIHNAEDGRDGKPHIAEPSAQWGGAADIAKYRELTPEEAALIYSITERVREITEATERLKGVRFVDTQRAATGKSSLERTLYDLTRMAVHLRDPIFRDWFSEGTTEC